MGNGEAACAGEKCGRERETEGESTRKRDPPERFPYSPVPIRGVSDSF